jgi:hypothetical protein
MLDTKGDEDVAPHFPPHASDATKRPRMMLDRRQFLGVAATGVAISLTGAIRVRHHDGSDSESDALAHPELLVTLGAEAVREIGDTYRSLVPAESDRASLETALRAELRAARASNEDPIRADFAAGRVIVVRDWMLSHTEARQCALFSLPA